MPWDDRRWTVARFMLYEGDTEPSWGITYQGDQEGAWHIYEQYADAGEHVELRFQPDPVRPPEQVIASSRTEAPK